MTSSGAGLGVHDVDSLSFLDRPAHVIVREHASDILSRAPCCLLCGQRMLDVRRIKTHWQAIHKAEWAARSANAGQPCRTLSKALQRPCQFCHSNAKDPCARAPQCAMLFQAMLMKGVRERVGAASPQGKTPPRPTLPRRSKQVAQRKSFSLSNTPLGQAFRKSTAALAASAEHQTGPVVTKVDRCRDDGSLLTPARNPSRQSSLLTFFGSREFSLEGTGNTAVLWTLRLRLSNPHSLRYLNAGVLSMVHCPEVMGSSEYSALVQMCKQAQNSNRLLSLSQ